MLKLQKLEIFNDAGIWNRKLHTPDSESIPQKGKIQALPSWAPEHRILNLTTSHPLPWSPAKMNRNWDYCQPKMMWPKTAHETRVFVKGVRLGSVQWTAGCKVTPDSVQDLQSFLRVSWECLILEGANKDGARYPLTDESMIDALYAAFHTAFPLATGDSDSYDSLYLQLERSAFLRTKEGYIGYSPGALEPNDTIVAFCGLAGPYIIRPVSGTPNFQLFGPCYIHGMMKREFEYGDKYEMISLIRATIT